MHILDAYDGRRYCVPMVQGDRPLEAVREQRNYYAFRALGAAVVASKVLGEEQLSNSLYLLCQQLFDEYGDDRPIGE